jgi:putative SOS response-associated peptidase YedK
VFAIAGIWRDTDEWGPAYSMVMTEACIHVEGVHDRMPVILRPDDWTRWTDASAEDARSLCIPYAGEMAINRTDELWRSRLS